MANNNIIFPSATKENAINKAKLILRSSGLQAVTPKFFAFNTVQMQREQDEEYLATQDLAGDRANYFGQPVFDAIYFPGFKYTDPQTGKEIQNGEVIIDTALFEINIPKNIVKTQIQGRNGTIKEYINDDDAQIKITGMLVGKESNVPPRKLIHDVNELRKAPVTLEVASNFLNYFEIYSLVVESTEFAQIEGTRNAVLFTLNCTSDVPYEIQYNKNQVIVKRSKAFF